MKQHYCYKPSSYYLITLSLLFVTSSWNKGHHRAVCWGLSSNTSKRSPGMSSSSSSSSTFSHNIGWIGLGTMGEHMAMHLQNSRQPQQQQPQTTTASPVQVWNRNADKATAHSSQYGTRMISNLSDMCRPRSLHHVNEEHNDTPPNHDHNPSIIFISMPTTTEVKEILQSLQLDTLAPGSIIVDTTSGDPSETRSIAQDCRENYDGVTFVDCPVSGGLAGAKAGILTCMVGCHDPHIVESIVQPLLESSFAGKVVYCGPSGSGMAVKAINNVLMSAHLLLGAEGLLALKNFGVDPTIALEVINSSSGRSMQTMERLPQDVLTGTFDFGFKLPLMAKDCRIAASIAEEQFPQGTLIPEVSKLMNQANELLLDNPDKENKDDDADVTEAVKMLEDLAGTDLRSS